MDRRLLFKISNRNCARRFVRNVQSLRIGPTEVALCVQFPLFPMPMDFV
jgi:hypothetical protein